MTQAEVKLWVDQLLFSVSQAVGVTLPRILGIAIGLIVLILLVMRVWERKMKIAPAILMGLAPLGLVIVSLDTAILHQIFASTDLDRIRFLLGVLSVIVIAVTFESIRISRLRERFALLWLCTGGIVLVASLFPSTINFLSTFFGVGYVDGIVLLVFIFLLLVTFHFSIALSRVEGDKAQVAQRCALLEMRLLHAEKHLGLLPPVRTPVAEGRIPEPTPIPDRSVHGVFLTSMLVIVMAFFMVFITGVITDRPLVGDEVTHYHLLENQAQNLSEPNFAAKIPVESQEAPELRLYPHPNGWHYIGALLFKVFFEHSVVVQIYQSLFWLQFLIIAYAWSTFRRGTQARSSLLFVVVLASIPMNVLFSVTFYQDIPMTAQVLTAFYLLDRRKIVLSGLFLGLALWIKVTAILFVPPFLIVAFFHLVPDAFRVIGHKRKACAIAALRLLFLVAVVGGMTASNQYMIHKYAEGHNYYPIQIMRNLNLWPQPKREISNQNESNPKKIEPLPERENTIVANHPGDLREVKNFIVYGGVLFWVVLGAGLIVLFRPRSPHVDPSGSRKHSWPLLVGIFYVLAAAYLLRTSPDARFFLPGIPFILMPLCEWAMRLPRNRILIVFALMMSLLQSGYVLQKIIRLRSVSPELIEGVEYLRAHPPVPRKIFMYPEGNYRIFPIEHDWYLNYSLPIFWKENTDERIDRLQKHKIGAIVVKKHLIKRVIDPERELGSYPPEFVQSLNKDPRFVKEFSNSYMSIYKVPSKEALKAGP